MKLRTIQLCILIQAASCASMDAAECGSSGNTYWTYGLSASATGTRRASADTTNLYFSAGAVLYNYTKSGLLIQSLDLPWTSLGRPITGVLHTGGRLVAVAGDNGVLYARSPISLNEVWTRSIQRGTCGADSIRASPAMQLRADSDMAFQAAVSGDLVFIGTDYQCGTITANRVYGLNAADGTLKWIYNSTGSAQMDTVNGLAVDYGRNTVYVTSDHRSGGPQNSLWALAGTNGARRWALDLGPIQAEPMIAGNALYVTTYAGMLYKLNPNDGAVVWNVRVTCSAYVSADMNFDATKNRIYLVDTGGELHAVDDLGTCARRRWSLVTGAGGSFCTQPALLASANRLYVGATDGRVYQINPDTGASPAYASISATAAPVNQILLQETGVIPGEGARLFVICQNLLKKLCIPWPDTPGDKS